MSDLHLQTKKLRETSNEELGKPTKFRPPYLPNPNFIFIFFFM